MPNAAHTTYIIKREALVQMSKIALANGCRNLQSITALRISSNPEDDPDALIIARYNEAA